MHLTFITRRKEWSSRLLVSWSLSPRLLPLYSRCPLVKYVPNDDELLESESLEIVGEDPGNESLRTGTVPVRILTEFSVFDAETGEMAALHSFLAPRDSPQLSSTHVTGYVLPAMENAVDAVEEILDPDLEDYSHLRLSTIRSMNLFHFDEDHKVLDRYIL